MINPTRKVILLLTAMLLLAGLFAGCTQTQSPGQTAVSAASPSQTTDSQQTTVAKSTPAPAAEPITLTQLTSPATDIDQITGGDPNKMPWIIELEKRTGVHIDFIITTEYETKLNLLISSGDMPDLFAMPSSFPGGLTKAAKDGIIATISDYWEKDAPNLRATAESNPEWLKCLKADDGAVYAFPVFRENQTITVFFGPMIRKDLLDTAGLGIPETIDDWHIALAKFKENGVKNPFTALNWFIPYSDAFVGAYGVSASGNIVPGLDGKMHYGPIEAGYKQYLETFGKWYSEGLIDPDYPTLTDWGVLQTKITTGESAAMVHFLSMVNDTNVAGKPSNPSFEMVATKYPVLNKGDTPVYGQKDPPLRLLLSVSAKSKNIERALSYLDYGYSAEGQTFFNFGIEGESYTLDANGKPVYTDLIKATPTNTKGWTQAQALAMYCPASGDYMTVQSASYFDQIRLTTDSAKQAVALWSEPKLSSIPPTVSLTDEETETAKKLADVETYVTEMTTKFILGTEPLSNFDQYVTRCKELGINEVLAVYNAAYDRYNKR